MSYGQAVTMLDQLPNLDDLETNTGPPMGSHMGSHMGPPMGSHMDNFSGGLPHGMEEKYQKYIRGNHRMSPESGMLNMEQPMNYGVPVNQEPPPPEPHVPFINCIDIAKHVQDCPICSKFYRNDNSVYIIVIVVLAIVCLLLLKRVLNV